MSLRSLKFSRAVENPKSKAIAHRRSAKKKDVYELRRDWVKTKQKTKSDSNWNQFMKIFLEIDSWKIRYTFSKLYHSKFSNTTIKQNGHDWLHLLRRSS